MGLPGKMGPAGEIGPPGPPGNDGEDRDPGVPGSMGEVVYTHVACLGTVDIWRHKDKCMRSFVISTTVNLYTFLSFDIGIRQKICSRKYV